MATNTMRNTRAVIYVMNVLYVVLALVAVNGEDTSLCPTGCICETSGTLNCSDIGHIPDYAEKGSIHTLIISPNNIAEIKSGDLANFTQLEQLDLQKGNISLLGEGAFDDIKATVKRIVLKLNKIKDLPSNVFKDLPKLDKLNLNSNHLSKLVNGSFSGLSNLVTLTLEANRIHEIEVNAFKDVPQLQDLNFYLNNFTEIPFASLKQVTGLVELDLSQNKIETVSEEVDAFFPALEDIDLESNPIKSINVFPNVSTSLKILNLAFTNIFTSCKDTWKFTQSLKTLYIMGTKYTHISQGMFEGLQNLKVLSLTDTHTVTSIGPNAFADLPNVNRIHVSRNSKLVNIDESAFKFNKNLTSVFLRHNALSTFQQKLLPWAEINAIYLDLNPLVCDCRIKWMLNASLFGNNTNVKNSISEMNCTAPSHVIGRKVGSLHRINLVCSPVNDRVTRFTTGIVVAVVCFTITAAVVVIVKFRKRILMSTRRYFQYRRYKNEMIFTVENDTSIAELDDTETRPLKEMRLETVPL